MKSDMKTTTKLLNQMLNFARRAAREPDDMTHSDAVPPGFVSRLEARLARTSPGGIENGAAHDTAAASGTPRRVSNATS